MLVNMMSKETDHNFILTLILTVVKWKWNKASKYFSFKLMFKLWWCHVQYSPKVTNSCRRFTFQTLLWSPLTLKKYGFSLTGFIFDSVLLKNTGQRKLVFWHILHRVWYFFSIRSGICDLCWRNNFFFDLR